MTVTGQSSRKNDAFNRSSPSIGCIRASGSERACSVWERGLQFCPSLSSERSEVGGCAQWSPQQWGTLGLALVLSRKLSLDALGESMLKCLDANAAGYRVKAETFARDQRRVKSIHDCTEQPKCVKLMEAGPKISSTSSAKSKKHSIGPNK